MNGSNSSWSYGGAEGKFRHGNQWNDRQYNSRNNSTITKMQHQYWVTKETVFRKLGRKEDAYIVASDAELDAKLELFRSIQESCMDLQRIIDKYQERLCLLAQEENSMGRFLKECGKHDKTGAGNMMLSLGKTMSHSGQQRIALRAPLLRLFQEVDTFRQRAIEDTARTVQGMEKTRTEYRASLSWMKDVSQELDPDTFKQLDKFRKVQEHVKGSKVRFDRVKLDCLQKIDLLAAARCNMFSHALVTYHNTLLQFASASAHAFNAVAESFKEHQHFQFSVVKELSDLKPEAMPSGSTDQDNDDKLLDFEDMDEGGAKVDAETESENLETSSGLVGLLTDPEPGAKMATQNFLPSQLLMMDPPSSMDTSKQTPGPATLSNASSGANIKGGASWLELFSELDPLANPDSVGHGSGEPQRNC